MTSRRILRFTLRPYGRRTRRDETRVASDIRLELFTYLFWLSECESRQDISASSYSQADYAFQAEIR